MTDNAAASANEKLADWIERAAWVEIVEGKKHERRGTALLDHQRDLIVSALRQPAGVSEEESRLFQFFRWAMTTGPWIGSDLDGAAVQDKALELRLIVETKYDPAVHAGGECAEYAEPGDPWYTFAEPINRPQTGEVERQKFATRALCPVCLALSGGERQT